MLFWWIIRIITEEFYADVQSTPSGDCTEGLFRQRVRDHCCQAFGNHARRAFAHPEWKRWDLGRDGLAPLRCSRYQSRTVDRHASPVRSVADVKEASSKTCAFAGSIALLANCSLLPRSQYSIFFLPRKIC